MHEIVPNSLKHCPYACKWFLCAHAIVRIGSIIVFHRPGNLPTRNTGNMLTTGFLGAGGIVRKDFGRIPKGPKSADFEEKAWALAHGFEDGGFM